MFSEILLVKNYYPLCLLILHYNTQKALTYLSFIVQTQRDKESIKKNRKKKYKIELTASSQCCRASFLDFSSFEEPFPT